MRFDHVAHQVPDIGAAIAWWRELVPDTEVLYRDDSWALIAAGGAKLAFVRADQHPDHLALRVGARELDELAERHGAAVQPHRDGSRSFYLEAPGGHAVELVAYPEPAAAPGPGA